MHDFCKVVTFDENFNSCPNVIPVSTVKTLMFALVSPFPISTSVSQPLQKVITKFCLDFTLFGFGPKTCSQMKSSEFSNFFENCYFSSIADLKFCFSSNREEHNGLIIFGFHDFKLTKTNTHSYFNITSADWVSRFKDYIHGI